MLAFFAELKRRHVYRVAAAYAVVAWVLLQLFNNVEPILKLPDWAGTLVLVLLLVGFPVALLFAWIHQLALADGTLARPATGRLDWALMGALLVVIALVSYQQLAPATGSRTAQQANIANGSANAAGISIAVLPFVNLSGDTAQEFFSDGMTEEITSALAKVQSLRVVARASAFQFKGEKKDMRAVGQALNARYLIDGSVRKEGTRVRITAQLIEAGNGVSVWTDSYDRELTSVFATQEDIAQAIAGALRVPLGLQPGERLVADQTIDVDSYQQYLRARSLFRNGVPDEAVAVLEPVVARNPSYAPAWALLSTAYRIVRLRDSVFVSGSVEDARRAVEFGFDKAAMAAQKAIQSDSRNAGAYAALAFLQVTRGRWVEAEDLLRQALALDPSDPEILHRYRQMLSYVGRLRESLRVTEQLQTLEPFAPVYNLGSAVVFASNGQNRTAIAILEGMPVNSPLNPGRNLALARYYAAEGRYAESADTLLAVRDERFASRESIEVAARLIRTAPSTTGSPATLPALPGFLSFVYAYVGARDRMFEEQERQLQVGNIVALDRIWAPEFAPLRKTERFKAYVRKTGLVDYWRARGWPDLCRPMGADDFVCD